LRGARRGRDEKGERRRIAQREQARVNDEVVDIAFRGRAPTHFGKIEVRDSVWCDQVPGSASYGTFVELTERAVVALGDTSIGSSGHRRAAASTSTQRE
jgi:hypothetical protein